MNTTALPGIDQLHAPDPVGRDLALYRIRAYRFGDDLRHAVLAEVLEERQIKGKEPAASSISYVRACLHSVRTTGHILPFDHAIPDAEKIDLPNELAARDAHTTTSVNVIEPKMVVAIVGAPRSGTSHLFNLLARHTGFAYFTTVSCWAWPTYNLTRPGRRLFTDLTASEADTVLAVDNKNTRLIPGLVMPYEAEDVFARAIPTYRHINRHYYKLHQAVPGDTQVLSRSVSAHLSHFEAGSLLTKSPFNSLRIPHLQALWGTRVQFIHVIRDQADTADSMRRNHFTFTYDGTRWTKRKPGQSLPELPQETYH